jgi:hypothetical protein
MPNSCLEGQKRVRVKGKPVVLGVAFGEEGRRAGVGREEEVGDRLKVFVLVFEVIGPKIGSGRTGIGMGSREKRYYL